MEKLGKCKLYIHLGPHKTASTTLQENLFPNFPHIKFLGRFVNDFKFGSGLYTKIMNYCCNNDYDDVFDEIQQELSDELSKNSLLLSDEWLTSNYDGFSLGNGNDWKTKLLKLKKLIAVHDYQLIIINRETLDNIFSLYCEFKQIKYGAKYSSLQNFIEISPDADAIINLNSYLINGLGLCHIQVLEFSDLITNQEKFIDQLSCVFNSEISLKLQTTNTKISDESNVVINKRPFTLIFIRKYLLPYRIMSLLEYYFPRLPILKRKIVNIFSRKDVIQKPTAQEKDHLIKLIQKREKLF